MTKTVYAAMVADMLHAGHINIINKAKELGEVTVGVLTDAAVASYKRLPFQRFEQRKAVIESIAGIKRVVPQETLSYRKNLLELRPDYVVHGDDWRMPEHAWVRQEAIDTLKQWGGQVIEVPYTPGVSSTLFHEAMREQGVLVKFRQERLRRLVESKPIVRVIEVHNALSALIAEKARVDRREFDALWSSSLTDSIARGKPDIEVVDTDARLSTIAEIFEATPKPLIYDGDTGHSAERVYYMAKALDRCGVSALCIEDKMGNKRNSLLGNRVLQEQAPAKDFCARIRAAKSAANGGSLMVFARIESLVLGKPVDDALERARAYCEAGADAILIHSISSGPEGVFQFAQAMKREIPNVPIAVVPTTFNTTYEHDLIEHGINIVIYANQLMRAAYPAMVKAAGDILANQRSAELDSYCAGTAELLSLFPGPSL